MKWNRVPLHQSGKGGRNKSGKENSSDQSGKWEEHLVKEKKSEKEKYEKKTIIKFFKEENT